ncbi:MAG TPA: hypothetical protein QF353_01620 [Gammaproteobacteria bacterium]|nr:hypothetical protein [Gammaproteobacteria bacterium]
MISVSEYLTYLSKTKHNFYSVGNALLGTHVYQYLWFRLRYFSLRLIINLIFFLVEFAFILAFFSYKIILGFITLKLCLSIFSHGYWGLLENLREKVREVIRTRNYRKRERIARLNQAWYQMSVRLGLCILVVAAFAIYYHNMTSSQPFSSLELFYLSTILIQFSTRLVSLTLHSGVYAFKRVFRTPNSIIIAPVVGILAFLALWPIVGEYCLPAAVVIESIVSFVVTLYFILKMYSLERISFKYSSLMQFPDQRCFYFIKIKRVIAYMFSGAIIFAESTAIVILISFINTSIDLSDIYCIIPLIMACSTWPRLLYFDYKKFADPIFRTLTEKYNQMIYLYNMIFSGVILALSTLVLWVFGAEISSSLLLSLYCFFFTRSLLSMKQIELFSNHYHHKIIGYSFVYFILTALALTLVPKVSTMWLVISFLQFAHFLMLGDLSIVRDDHHDSRYLHTNINKALCNKNLRYIFKIKFIRSLRLHEIQELTTMMNLSKRYPGRTIIMNEYTILHFSSEKDAVDLNRLNKESHGLVFRLNVFTLTEKSRKIDIARFLQLAKCSFIYKQCKESAISQFKEYYPTGIVLDFKNPEDKKNLEKIAAMNVFGSFMTFLRHPLMAIQISPYYVSAIVSPDVEIIFIIPKSKEYRFNPLQWNRYVYSFNVIHSINEYLKY